MSIKQSISVTVSVDGSTTTIETLKWHCGSWVGYKFFAIGGYFLELVVKDTF